MTSSMSAIFGVLSELPMGAFTQEIVALSVFVASFLAWRHFKEHVQGRPPPRHNKKHVDSVKTATSSVPQCADAKQRAARGGSWQNNTTQRTAAPPAAAYGTRDVNPARLHVAEQQILQHLEHMEFTRALNLYRSFERDGRERYSSEELFLTFIQSAIRVGKIDVVERMMRTMKRNRFSPPLDFWQTTLKMLSSRKNFNACLSLASLFDRQIPCDKTIYSCLINASLELGDAERATGLLERYGQSGIDDRDYVLFFRTFVATGNVEAAEKCFHKLGTGTSTLMLNLLLLTCINAKDPERAFRLLCKAHGLQEGMTTHIVDTVSYNTVLKGFTQCGDHARCFEVLQQMLDYSLEPDDVTFGTLLDACIVDQKFGTVQDVVSLLTGRNKPMDTVMCTLFMKALVRSNCVPKALEVYDEMKRHEGAHPDIVTYSVLIKALVDQHDLQRALKMLEDLVEANLAADDIILTHLLEGCRHVANLDLGKKLFRDMVASGVKPSEFTLVTLLKLHGRCGANDAAYEVVATWEEKFGFKPSVIHYTCIMSGCLRTKKYDHAWAAYELMNARGVVPDETAISTLLPGLVAAQHWERVLTVVRKMLSSTPVQVKIPTETLNNALSQITAAGGARRYADQLHQLMLDAGVPVTMRNSKRSGA